jgi:hypothetical protein
VVRGSISTCITGGVFSVVPCPGSGAHNEREPSKAGDGINSMSFEDKRDTSRTRAEELFHH